MPGGGMVFYALIKIYLRDWLSSCLRFFDSLLSARHSMYHFLSLYTNKILQSILKRLFLPLLRKPQKHNSTTSTADKRMQGCSIIDFSPRFFRAKLVNCYLSSFQCIILADLGGKAAAADEESYKIISTLSTWETIGGHIKAWILRPCYDGGQVLGIWGSRS